MSTPVTLVFYFFLFFFFFIFIFFNYFFFFFFFVFFFLSIYKEGRGVGGTLRRLGLAGMGAWWALWACSVGACWHARLVRATSASTRKNTSATTHRAALARQRGHFLASVGRLLMWNGVAFGRAVSSRCCLACSRRRTHGAY